jgi:calcium-dependent protein kinase
MGGCFSGNEVIVPENDGGEEAYHSRFLEDKLLGEGEFGVVKLVVDMRANNGEGAPAACKTLRKGLVFKDNVLYSPLKPEVLKAECEILHTLAGEHYCLKLIAIYETPKLIYIVTELCAGGEMMEYVSKQANLRTEDVSRIAFQLLSAVNHCANHNIIHRDIKPENAMFMESTPGAELRLIDFGSSTMDKTKPGPDDRHTTFAGTAFYISPELFLRTYTTKTDVWSCGVTLYVLVAGYPADNLQKAFNILQKPKDRDLRTLPGMPDDMPDSFLDMLELLLCFKHKRRKAAREMLSHDFVQFHKTHSDQGLSLDDVVAAASVAVTTMEINDDSAAGTTGRPLQSISLRGSVRRHSVFLNYQQFERSVTTLLATLVSKKDLSILIQTLELDMKQDVNENGNINSNNSATPSVNKPTKLQVITISRLKELLKEMKQDEWYVENDVCIGNYIPSVLQWSLNTFFVP